MRHLLLVALLVSPAYAARYDPDTDRAALRQAATSCRDTVVDATGRPLTPEQASLISAGIDEGRRLSLLAADAARSLDAAAKARGAAMEAGTKESALDGKIKELAAPVAVERARREKLSDAQEALKKRVDALPEEERKKLKPLLSKASVFLDKAGDALAPLESALKAMSTAAPEMKESRRDALGPLAETVAAVKEVNLAVEEYSLPLAEAQARIAALGSEPREAARARAWEKIVSLRDAVVRLFQSADRACNRADEFRRRSNEYEAAAQAFEKARATAAPGPSSAKEFLDGVQAAQARLRDQLPHH